MKTENIKSQMMKLWENIFHDKKEYVDIIFSNYFNEDFIEYREEEGKIVSSLIGIPYKFSDGENELNGLYLCGLATLPDHRNRGIMTSLIEKFLEKHKNNFDVAFLIPSSGRNSYYYHSRGFHNGIYRLEQCFTSVHDYFNDYVISLNDSNDKIKKLKIDLYESIKIKKYEDNKEFSDKIIKFIRNEENKRHNYLTLQHTEKDLETALNENNISGDEIYFCITTDEKVTGVAFVKKDQIDRITISSLYNSDNASFFKLLETIKKSYPSLPISIYQNPDDVDRIALWDEFSSLPDNEGAMPISVYGSEIRPYNIRSLSKPFGMIKILDYEKILKFVAKTRNDLKFSFVLKKEDKYLFYNIVKGDLTVREWDNKKESDYRQTILTENQLSNILFRKKDNSPLIMEAFGIPRLSFHISLMLD